jgi:DNA-binding protein YbaB
VTEPGLTPEQRVARVNELQQQASAAMTNLRATVAAAGEARQRALAVSGEAGSRDQTVRVKVDSTGVLTSLTIAPGTFEKTTPERLAATITATIQEAASRARSDMAEAMAPLREGAGRAGTATAAVPELRELRFGVPEVPRTATDPTTSGDPWAEAGASAPPAAAQPALSEEEAEAQRIAPPFAGGWTQPEQVHPQTVRDQGTPPRLDASDEENDDNEWLRERPW